MKDYQTILFLCTGNFYRSRFAEALFNFQASKNGLEWQAKSAGFRPHLATEDLSHYVEERLDFHSIPRNLTQPLPRKVTEQDLAGASLVCALYEKEHAPMMQEAFPAWRNRSHFWHIPDIDEIPPDHALPMIEAETEKLVQNLVRGHAMGAAHYNPAEF